MPVRTHAGLLVAEHAVDERAVRSALRKLDPALVLTVEQNDQHGRLEYVVIVPRGDRPPVTVASWRDDHGAPLPLTMGLVDHVQRLRADARVPYGDPEQTNARIRTQTREAMDQHAEDAAQATIRRHGRLPIFPRSRQLYLTRSRMRARGEDA